MKELLILVPANGSRPTKTITRRLKMVSSYTAGLNFRYEKHQYASFPEILKKEILQRKDCFLILGGLTEYGERQYEKGVAFPRRKKKDPPTIQDRDGPEIVLDLDGLLLEGFDPLNPEPGLKKYAKEIGLTADFAWQITSSQQLNTNEARLRIYLEADKDYSLAYRKAWSESKLIGADGSVYTSSQPIYTAAPIIKNGTDPIKRRFGFRKGLTRTQKLPRLSPIETKRASVNNSGVAIYDFAAATLPEEFINGSVYRRYLMPCAMHYANKGMDREAIFKIIHSKALKSPRPFDAENVYQYIDAAISKIESENESSAVSRTPLEDLLRYSATGKSKRMAEQMLKDVFVLKGLAILGQWTVFYGAPNTGKTLFTLWLLSECISEGRINGSDVFYANCDDTYSGSVEKLRIAESKAFHMLIPSENEFTPKVLLRLMEGLIQSGDARGKVIILDTLKKFTDLMDKKLSSEFGGLARRFILGGGTIICLAHVNKRKGEDGKVIHAGTSDIKDDADCVYILENVTEKAESTGTRIVVEFENQKSRGDVERRASFQYVTRKGAGYEAVYDSVSRLTDQDTVRVLNESERAKRQETDKDIINSVSKLISEKDLGKCELVDLVINDTALPRRKVVAAIDAWTGNVADGGMWEVHKSGKNKHIYRMNKAGLQSFGSTPRSKSGAIGKQGKNRNVGNVGKT